MSNAVYRLDHFIVPNAAREEFLARVRVTHTLLHAQPGFVRDDVMVQQHGEQAVRVVTLAQWRDEAAVKAAREKVAAAHAANNVNPEELLARLGIRAELGMYQGLDG
jgi:heme-degrading monooxygenase HmoA